MCKAVMLDNEKGEAIDFHIIKTGWNPKGSGYECMNALLDRNGFKREDVCVCSTGYGREAIDFADHTFTEITCHGFGAMYLMPNIGGVIDIGGQDSKVIQIKDKKLIDFLMNDKCAAGTGRFLSMACDILEVELFDIGSFANPNEMIAINSMCTVFAESEIISSLAMQKDRTKIMRGVLGSIANKISQMTVKFDFDVGEPILMTGGLSRSGLLINIISETTGLKVVTHERATFAGAIGACICAMNKNA